MHPLWTVSRGTVKREKSSFRGGRSFFLYPLGFFTSWMVPAPVKLQTRQEVVVGVGV